MSWRRPRWPAVSRGRPLTPEECVLTPEERASWRRLLIPPEMSSPDSDWRAAINQRRHERLSQLLHQLLDALGAPVPTATPGRPTITAWQRRWHIVANRIRLLYPVPQEALADLGALYLLAEENDPGLVPEAVRPLTREILQLLIPTLRQLAQGLRGEAVIARDLRLERDLADAQRRGELNDHGQARAIVERYYHPERVQRLMPPPETFRKIPPHRLAQHLARLLAGVSQTARRKRRTRQRRLP